MQRETPLCVSYIYSSDFSFILRARGENAESFGMQHGRRSALEMHVTKAQTFTFGTIFDENQRKGVVEKGFIQHQNTFFGQNMVET